MASLLAARRSLFALRKQYSTVSSLATPTITQSPSDAKIIRILQHEAEHQYEFAPPRHPATKFNSFVVQDRPGVQCTTMTRTFGNSEEIKLQVTMFDGFARVIKAGDDDDQTVEDLRHRVGVVGHILKKEEKKILEFVCAAWRDRLEIQLVNTLDMNKEPRFRDYVGPNFRNLSGEVQKRFREYLNERGVNDELCMFLHQYMLNKDRIELIRWFGKDQRKEPKPSPLKGGKKVRLPK